MIADAFAKGAEESGNSVEKITLYDKNIGYCNGCLACQKTQKCVIRDDAGDIVKKMLMADVIVFATPIYFYEMCGQMKTLLDRTNPLFTMYYSFRDIYLLASAAEEEENTIAGAKTGLEGWIACFEKARLSGTLFAGGVTNVGDIKDHAALKKACEILMPN